MKKTRCYSVRLKSLTSISQKCWKAISFDGSECLIPKSQVFGQDYEVSKSDAYWIAAWFLEKEDIHIQFSHKKEGWYNSSTRKVMPTISFEITHHEPIKLNPVIEIESLSKLSK